MRLLLPAIALFLAALVSANAQQSISDAAITDEANPTSLSVFGFFGGGADRPSGKLIAYSLRTPLFSDYAEKQRFIYLPKGTQVTTEPDGRMVFPVGAALIKSFGYPAADGKLKIIETRLLLHRANGWVALPYVWRADGIDAALRVGGTRVPASFAAPNGKTMTISYAVPNKNQCKQCHSTGDALTPIGPIWQNMALSDDAKARLMAVPPKSGLQDAIWDDPQSGFLELRALSYLRVNCGHCHKPSGSASNSGLFFDDNDAGKVALGIGKRPVAAGRASGDMDFVIDPGHPDRSILISRMKSTDPGIAMPELGRATVHAEGVKLLEEWIVAMPQRTSQ